MIQFSPAMLARTSIDDADFAQALKAEIEQLDARLLPLQQGLSVGGYALFDNVRVMVISIEEQGQHLWVKTGLFYCGVIAGCSCADDPTPMDKTTEYCEVMFEIDRGSGEGVVSLVVE